MPIDSVTVRLTKADRANLAAIADAMRATTRDPFVTRSTIVKTALSAAASDPAWLMRVRIPTKPPGYTEVMPPGVLI